MRAARQGALTVAAALIAAGASFGLAACSGGGDSNGSHGDQAKGQDNRPNIVLIQADDQTADQFRRAVMPKTFKDLVDHGTRFSDYIATTAECCPSRTSLITGQYAHNDGVTSNAVGYAGLVGKHDVLPVWLRHSGYRTMEVGAKYVNGYKQFSNAATDIAPGWRDWFEVLSHTQYYDYRISANGQHRARGHHPDDYVTRVLTRKATGLIGKRARRPDPFYLQLDERAPHVSLNKDAHGNCDRRPVPDPRDEHAFAHAQLPEPPSFNEADMSDKPPFLAAAPPVGSNNEKRLTAKWRCALEALVGVDRSVAKVFQAVKKSGELNNTVFIYVSDNGLFYGEHRLVEGKVFPYEAASRLPFVVRLPKRYRDGAPRLDHTGKLVGNIDIAPTILDLTGVKPCVGSRCRTMDGRSLMPLLDKRGHWPRDRPLLNEYRVPDVARYSTCEFASVRTQEELFVEHYRVVDPNTGDCHPTLQVERYNLIADPFELDNKCEGGGIDSCPHDATETELENTLERLKHCAGTNGRHHRVAGRPFCG